jgi:hypothetical protein
MSTSILRFTFTNFKGKEAFETVLGLSIHCLPLNEVRVGIHSRVRGQVSSTQKDIWVLLAYVKAKTNEFTTLITR